MRTVNRVFELSHKVACAIRLNLEMPLVARIISRINRENLTYLESVCLADLARAVLRLESRGIEGAIIEAGCALGGSAIVLAASKKKKRPMYVYDVFATIPPPSEKDPPDVHERYRVIASGLSEGIGGELYYGYQPDLYEKVRVSFALHGLPVEENSVRLIKGMFQQTLKGDWPVALAHLDCDWYESVMTCLQRIEPRLVRGGTLVIDDYDAWGGCRRAVDEYFARRRDGIEFVKRNRLHIVKR
jgi:Macrocin-O-methyltransferase (TylF)